MDETTVTKQALSGPLLERVFGLRAAGTDLRTEFLGGFTTFLTMVYIVFVNPQILGNTGMDKGAVFVANVLPRPPRRW
jgi:AGZA family xanthine/uracil permease-like MFS transporter